MLKMIVDVAPEGLEQYYETVEDGKLRLKVEGAVSVDEYNEIKSKNKEFRDRNIGLMKENEKFKNFSELVGGDLNPDKFNEKVESLANSKISSLTETMKTSYETKIKDLEAKLSQRDSKLSTLVLDNEVTKVATEHGVLSSALEDVMLRAKNAFKVVDGEVKFIEERLDAEGKPYSISSWMQEQKTKATHLFAPSQGTGSKRPNGSGVKSPGGSVSGPERIAAALANRNNGSAKRLNH